MQRLVHRRYRLDRLVRSLEYPRQCFVKFKGNYLKLPLRVEHGSRPKLDPRLSESRCLIKELSYSFSVFGWLLPYHRGNGIRIYVTTRLSRASIPLEFWSVFGGGVYLEKTGKAPARPCVSWRLSGDRAIEVIKLLVDFGEKTRKHDMLKIVSDWSNPENVSKHVRAFRKELRQNFLSGGKIESWKQFAELFDARGQIIMTSFNQPRLLVSHRNKDLLESIASFLNSEGVIKTDGFKRICNNVNNSYWYCVKRDHIRTILSKLLENGLQIKSSNVNAAFGVLDELDPVRRRHLLEQIPFESTSHIYKRVSLEEFLLNDFGGRLLKEMSILKTSKKKASGSLRKISVVESKLSVLRPEQERLKLEGQAKKARNIARSLIRQSNGEGLWYFHKD